MHDVGDAARSSRSCGHARPPRASAAGAAPERDEQHRRAFRDRLARNATGAITPRARAARGTPCRTASGAPSRRCPSGTPRSGRSLLRRPPGGRCRGCRRRRARSASPARIRYRRARELGGRRAKDERERGGAADDEQDQREVESPHELEERVDRAGRAFAPKTCLHAPLALAVLTWKTNAPATGCESAEITRQVTVYVPGGSLRSSVDRDRALARPDDLSRVHALAAAVVDADRAERRLDGLVELQRDRRRALPDDRVVARCATAGGSRARTRTAQRPARPGRPLSRASFSSKTLLRSDGATGLRAKGRRALPVARVRGRPGAERRRRGRAAGTKTWKTRRGDGAERAPDRARGRVERPRQEQRGERERQLKASPNRNAGCEHDRPRDVTRVDAAAR